MELNLNEKILIDLGLEREFAHSFLTKLTSLVEHCYHAEQAWELICKQLLSSPIPFNIHLLLFSSLFPKWHSHPESAPAWLPPKDLMQTTNISRFMVEHGMHDVAAFHHWSTQYFSEFWHDVVKQLQIIFNKPYTKICNLTNGVASPRWFQDATMNIVNSCFQNETTKTAIIYQDKNKNLRSLSYGELNELSNRIANSLIAQGFKTGDAMSIIMPMNDYAVAAYLGIIKMGGIVVSIADSFSAEEIALRLTIGNAKAIITQDYFFWGGKEIALYKKIKQACEKLTAALKIIVVSQDNQIQLRRNDLTWENFLVTDNVFQAVPCDPMSACNILFSSGTTGEPKAIVWNHTTPIKVASDAFFHQNIQPNDVLAWPTNLGWMMGPWLIFAAFINKAAIALYTDAPKDKAFGEFVQQANVTMLGVVPTLVATWRQSHCMEELDWRAIKIFSSTGECSNPEDMLYLMSLAGYKPIIEYCGGTEIGGAYLSSTLVQPNYPSLFTTPAMGLGITILNEQGQPSTTGEVAIIPPSIGLSTLLLNANHQKVYFADMPLLQGKILRRHGDQIKQYANGTFSILGRVDDTMNLGGIKTSAAEIERVLTGIEDILEVAAIAITPPHNGPSTLVIYAATPSSLNKLSVMQQMQKKINSELNPLFKIFDVVFLPQLPKTASNKIMRRLLRTQYLTS